MTYMNDLDYHFLFKNFLSNDTQTIFYIFSLNNFFWLHGDTIQTLEDIFNEKLELWWYKFWNTIKFMNGGIEKCKGDKSKW